MDRTRSLYGWGNRHGRDARRRFIVDFQVAPKVIEDDWIDMEFAGYTRICEEGVEKEVVARS